MAGRDVNTDERVVVRTINMNLHGQRKLFRDRISRTWRALNRWVSATFFLFLFIFLVAAFVFWFDLGVMIRQPFNLKFLETKLPKHPTQRFPFNCTNQACSTNYSSTAVIPQHLSSTSCPDYFQWIHEDLRPWKSAGITREMLESAKNVAHFRLVILNGKAYVEHYDKAFQTRDVFTIWGILQLLRLYPGKVPDLELMFNCWDGPAIQKRDYQGDKATLVPPLFHYCGCDDTFGIVFPDWSLWGWPEVNIKPWTDMLNGIIEGSKKTGWKKRIPYGYWRGNPHVSPNREDLMKCRANESYDWNVRLHEQNWGKESKQGYKHSNLEDQCHHRYKIYIEGRGWSVSQRYILACDSMTLFIKPKYYDFFSRSLMPLQHYWPIRATNMCRDLKFGVEWGNKHPDKAQAIGKAGSEFIRENLKMQHIYSYMFHLLSEYAKLLKFKPRIPTGNSVVCAQSMACAHFEAHLIRKFMVDSMVTSPSEELPCTMPDYDPAAIQAHFDRKENVTKEVEMWEKEYWHKLKNKPQENS